MIDPTKIIQNKAQTLANGFGDPLENINATEMFEDMKNATSTIYDASGAMSVLSDSVSKIDVAGLATSAKTLGQKIPALADIEDPSAIFPPGLNAFANGFGGALASKAEALVEQVIPAVKGMSVGEINSYVTEALDSVGNGIVNAVEEELEKFQEKHKDTARGENSAPEPEPKAPGVTLKNPLRSFNSYNAIFTLGVLTADSANNPSQTYIANGADYTILRSGGGGIDDKRIQSIYDTVGTESGNTEYFIDDFDMNAVVASNSKTGATQAISFSFSVKEPYSMGVFLQALQAAAFDAGFENYLQAPYLLELDFVGWDDDGGKPIAYSNRKLPFKLISIEFDVESGGSTYQVQCIPWNEQSFSQDVQELQDTISITGRDMVEILSIGEQSLSTVINEKLQHIANETCQPATDFYLVRFPTTRTGDIDTSYLRSAEFTNKATISDSEAKSSRKGDQAAETTEDDGVTSFFKRLGVDTSSSALLESLKSGSIQDLNKIGASRMITDFQEGGDNPFGLGLYAYDKDTNVYKRNGVELTMSDELRTFKFTQGTPITKVIEELLLVSEYGRTALNRVDSKGEIEWFRIESKCYIIDDRAYENATGETPKVYVYDVVPYKVDASRFSATNQANSGIIEKAKHTVKTYNYIYSGQNEDVLGFDIKFNAAFFQAIRMDMGQLSASDVINDREKNVTTQRHPTLGPPRDGNMIPEGRTRSVMKTGNFNGGSYNKQYGEELAKMFHNSLINSKVDLITAELEVWGDPYFIPDSGIGNFTSARGGSKNITAGGGLDHQRNEIDVVVNFRTPVDYNQDGTMLFPGATVAVDSFSGVYQVITANSKISGNKFTQTLELVRRRNQSTEGISEAKALIEKPGCTGLNPNPGWDGNVVGSDPQENTQNQNEIIESYGSNGELATIRSKNGKTTQVAKIYAENFQALIDELENDLGYEVRTLGGYVQRTSRGGTSPSYHASGLAIDINAAENPMVRPRPEDGPEPTDMPDGGTGSVISALAAKHGLGWGGDWNSATDAMHFSAAKEEGGALDWPRNGLVPGGNPPAPKDESTSTDTPRVPDQISGTSDATNETGGVANVQPKPSGQMARQWLRQYGATHNPDGTPKQSYVDAAIKRVSGTSSLTATQYSAYQQNFQTSEFGESTLRPYFPTEARDDLYDVQAGDKIRAIANFYTNQGVETSTPITRSQSGITYNEFGDPVYTGNNGTTAI